MKPTATDTSSPNDASLLLELPAGLPFSVVLVEPQIPQNAGNIARLCACLGLELHLVGQLGFRLSDRFYGRAGMDYFSQVHIQHWQDFESLLTSKPGWQAVYLSTKARNSHYTFSYLPQTMLVFGSETQGLPTEWIDAHPHQSIRLPMVPNARSLNLSNAVAVVAYEAIRQQHLRTHAPETDCLSHKI
ncbi:MAG: tRNA (cytidine(34)-2'-O)-methyltransferase [Candidatus Melainabacteria bacterium]|nr:tRNA (cytidine(34)-2'-O)-methyltransferase [Candidatus Melainabacteria bacterium]